MELDVRSMLQPRRLCSIVFLAVIICFTFTSFLHLTGNLRFHDDILVSRLVGPEDPYEQPNWFHEYFSAYNESSRMIHRWMGYFYPYDRHFGRFRGHAVNILEIGIHSGGSILMWKAYFGPRLNYFGLDINPDCKQFEEKHVKIFIADQGNKEQLGIVAEQLPMLDIIIDDGGHTMDQQKNTFERMFPLLKRGGVYLIEDVHTAYWDEYGGGSAENGVANNNTIIDMSKTWIDIINLNYNRNPKAQSSAAWKSLHADIGGVMFYDSLIILEKTRVKPNQGFKRGSVALGKRR